VNIAVFLNLLPHILMALLLWPVAHIPLGAPIFLAGKEKQGTGLWVLAGSLAVGQAFISAITYLLYICGLRFPALGFVVIGITIPFWAWGLFLLIKNPPRLRETRWPILGLIFTGLLLLAYVIMGVMWDEGYHFSKIASILNGDHPYFVPGGTRGFLRAYHFGVDFLASFWVKLALPWRPWVALNVICFWSAISAYALFHKFAKSALSEPWASLMPLMAFWLGAWYSVYGFWDMIAHQQSLAALYLNFYNTSFFGYFFQPPMSFGLPLLLAALCLAEERRFWRAGAVAGPLLLANQALFVFWAGYSALAGLIRERGYLRFLIIGIVLAIPFLPHLTARGFSNPTEFRFGLPILWLMRAWEPYPATFPLAYILFFFPLLPFYVHGAWVSLRNKGVRRSLLPLVLITATSFVAPHFIRYVHTEDFFKFFMLWGVFGMPLVLLSVSELWKRRAWRWAIVLSLAPGILSYALGFTSNSLQTRRLMGWENLRPDIIVVNETLKGKGGVLIVAGSKGPGMGIERYASTSGEGTIPPRDKRMEYILRILASAGIPHYPGQIYGRAIMDYEPLNRTWASLEEIPDSLLSALNVRYLALPPDLPRPARAGEPVLIGKNIAIYPIIRD
jgi:hypothetical protein